MKIEDQCVSLELAKKLKELGFKQDSYHAYYGNAGTWSEELVDTNMYLGATDEFINTKLLSAYTVAELGEILPVTIIHASGYLRILCDKLKNGGWSIKYKYHKENKFPKAFITIQGKTEAEVRAKMLIYLKNNQLI